MFMPKLLPACGLLSTSPLSMRVRSRPWSASPALKPKNSSTHAIIQQAKHPRTAKSNTRMTSNMNTDFNSKAGVSMPPNAPANGWSQPRIDTQCKPYARRAENGNLTHSIVEQHQTPSYQQLPSGQQSRLTQNFESISIREGTVQSPELGYGANAGTTYQSSQNLPQRYPSPQPFPYQAQYVPPSNSGLLFTNAATNACPATMMRNISTLKTKRPTTSGRDLQEQALRNAPQPDWAYVQQAHNTPFAMPTPQTLLIILDLNGTLLARPNRKNKRQFVKRPSLDEFLGRIMSKHRVMIWSSARPDSVDHMVSGIMGSGNRVTAQMTARAIASTGVMTNTQSLRSLLVAEWNRSDLRLSPAAYQEKVQVYKQLEWVWNSEQVQISHPRHAEGVLWDQTNTVLIDDSALKASSEPFNHIKVEEFMEPMLVREARLPVLRELAQYIDEASHFEDVSTFIRAHPFEMPGDARKKGQILQPAEIAQRA